MYFHALRERGERPTVFLHVPPEPEQAAPGAPSMAFADVVRAVVLVAEALLEEGRAA